MAVQVQRRRSRRRKTGPARGRARSKPAAPGNRPSPTATLPGWTDLAGKNRLRRGRAAGHPLLDGVSTSRFAVMIVAIAVLITLYVGHVHATQDLLAEVQQQRQENLRLHLKHNRLKGEFDRMVGPAVIYERARAQGLVEEPDFGPPIEIEP